MRALLRWHIRTGAVYKVEDFHVCCDPLVRFSDCERVEGKFEEERIRTELISSSSDRVVGLSC